MTPVVPTATIRCTADDFGAQCLRPEGHDGNHRAEQDGATISWPKYLCEVAHGTSACVLPEEHVGEHRSADGVVWVSRWARCEVCEASDYFVAPTIKHRDEMRCPTCGRLGEIKTLAGDWWFEPYPKGCDCSSYCNVCVGPID